MTKVLYSIGYATPIVTVLGLFMCYLMAPEFYLTHILEEVQREQGAVEIVTFWSAMMGGSLLLWSSWKFWKNGNWPAAGVIGAVSAATLLFAGEEIGWGQIYFGWDTPLWWSTRFGGSTDLHSSRFPAHTVAAIFLFVIFILLPLVWKFQLPLRLPANLKPAIPEGPVIFAIVFATLYRELKGFYFWLTPLGYRDRFYEEFLWGLNEHKEMLIAIAMLLYALYRLPHLKQIRSPS
ncbi:hypothetical protein PJI16_12900 [Nitrospira sp. MA-1]|nr:hypothetical protein [Nitrospira sp. MA-1]